MRRLPPGSHAASHVAAQASPLVLIPLKVLVDQITGARAAQVDRQPRQAVVGLQGLRQPLLRLLRKVEPL
eukprot:306638-Prymnesium_polylepis.1